MTSLLDAIDPDDHPGRIIERVMQIARDHLGLDVSFVSEFEGGQRIFRYAGGELERFHIQVDGADPLQGTYCQMVVDGTIEPLIPSASRHPVTGTMEVTRRLGIEAHMSVPVRFSNGQLYGTFCCFSGRADDRLSDHDVAFLRMTAAIVAEQLERDEIANMERRSALKRIRSILARGCDVVYQPIVGLAANDVLGYEALARFDGAPQRPTQEWFDEAWAVGLGIDLELAAMRRAVEEFQPLWPWAYLAINVSPETLLSPVLNEALAGMAADRIVLEITEHAHVFDYQPVVSALDKLRLQGFRVAIDDLGTGHAGINHLLQFRPDVFKIDMAVVQGIRWDPLRRAVASTFATLAANVGASVVAEGIETREDRDALEILGLTAGQGYYFARPMPMADIRHARLGGGD